MNRIILIGNGFDLAHGLETSYGHFIADYWSQFSEKIYDRSDSKYDYLRHIKSIRYLETDNYRRLLTFIDSAPYQIYVMGHSCGNSDRTLLNTLFEHANCVSIKPFYHLRPDGTEDYIDIVYEVMLKMGVPLERRKSAQNDELKTA